MKVFVYFNLHKKLFSVKALEGPEKGLVIAHKELLTLTNATPKVSEKGRQRVLQERRKNVHAGIVGEWEPIDPDFYVPASALFCIRQEITYNPYKYRTFVFKDDTRIEYKGSEYAVLCASDRSIHTYEVLI